MVRSEIVKSSLERETVKVGLVSRKIVKVDLVQREIYQGSLA